MDSSIIANPFPTTIQNGIETPISEAINIPGTIVGNLGNVASTNKFMQEQARYNNYLTDIFGAAQMASDRYMSLKERIPMSIEYYLTPSQKKEVVLYINPNKINISTQKVKAKVFTRGGIYFHHYGDDVWTLDITGETGMSQMKGIEALEEVYHYSGTLLKYTNVDVTTVHTNNIKAAGSSGSGGATGDLLSGVLGAVGLEGIANTAKEYINNKVVGTLGDALGMNNKGSVQDALKGTSGCFGGVVSQQAGNNLLGKVTGAATNQASGALSVASLISGIGSAVINPAKSSKENLNDLTSSLKNIFSGYDKNIIGNIATDALLGATGYGTKDSNANIGGFLDQLGFGLSGAVDGLATFLNGGNSPYAMPNQATQGNYYTLGSMTTMDLQRVVNTVQTLNKERLINKDVVANAVSDINDNLTDLYRPRQIFIYFDDRVFLGHFDQFTWTRQATTMSISYSMKFTITRQIKVNRQNIRAAGTSSSSSSGFNLKNVLTGVGLNVLGGALGALMGGGGKTNVKDASDNSGFNNELFSQVYRDTYGSVTEKFAQSINGNQKQVGHGGTFNLTNGGWNSNNNDFNWDYRKIDLQYGNKGFGNGITF